MPSSVLDYVILLVIFIIVIKISVNVFKKQESCPQNNNYLNNNNYERYSQSNENISKKEETQITHEKQKSNEPTKTETVGETKGPIDLNIYNDNYIKDFVLGGKFKCGDVEQEVRPYSSDDIFNYQDRFFSFGDKINRSSEEGVDPVDKINEFQHVRNSEVVKGEESIAQIYDNLTQGVLDKKKNCVNQGCLLPPQMDAQFKTGVYQGSGMGSYMGDNNAGKFYENYHWKYEDDNVNNGGKFYDDVEAENTGDEYFMAV